MLGTPVLMSEPFKDFLDGFGEIYSWEYPQ